MIVTIEVLNCGCTLTSRWYPCKCSDTYCPCRGNYKLLTPCNECTHEDHRDVMLETIYAT
jgi:hypothetical protein